MQGRIAQKRLYPLSVLCEKYAERQLPPIYPLQILTQRGGFLGRVKVRNLVLLMAVTLFQRTKPERSSFVHQQVPLSPPLDFVTID